MTDCKKPTEKSNYTRDVPGRSGNSPGRRAPVRGEQMLEGTQGRLGQVHGN